MFECLVSFAFPFLRSNFCLFFSFFFFFFSSYLLFLFLFLSSSSTTATTTTIGKANKKKISTLLGSPVRC